MTDRSPGTDPDLAACDLEPLAFSGRIQDEGALLICSESGEVTHASENLQRYFSRPARPGLQLQELFADDTNYFQHRRKAIYGQSHFVVRNVVTSSNIEGDLLVSECAGRVLYEFEPRGESPNPLAAPPVSVQHDAAKLPAETDIDTLLQQVYALTRHSKIMVYRFLEDDTGEVVAELSDGSLDSYLGLRFPASDIPRNARSLYIDNPFRLIFDTEGATVRVLNLQQTASEEEEAPDLSTSTLRSVSPLHIEYLDNMGVRASCSFSVRVMGKLWGLVALHATTPTRIDITNRLRVRELIDRSLSLSLMNARIQSEHQRFNSSIGLVERCARSLAELLRGGGELPLKELQELIDCDSLLLLRDGEVLVNELDLAPAEVQKLSDLARQQRLHGQFSTDSLSRFMEQEDTVRSRLSGLLYQAIGSGRANMELEIFWLRQEAVTTVHWAGQPQKLRREVDGEVRISPRQSFDEWTEQARGMSRPWANSDHLIVTKLAAEALAELVGIKRPGAG